MEQLKSISSDYILQYSAELNDRCIEIDSALYHHIQRFNRWILEPIPLMFIDVQDHKYDPSLLALYASMKRDTAPPILFDSVDCTIIDGVHRVFAAFARGENTVMAYVGCDPNLDWKIQ